MSKRSQTGFLAAALLSAALALAPAAGASPRVVLHDQYDNAGTSSTSSQNFEPAADAFDDELADDFVVPGGVGWSIEGVEVQGEYFNGPGPAASVNVRVYADSGSLPGGLLASRENESFTNGSSFVIALSSPISLGAGTYWVSVQANQDFATAGQWGWTDRTVQSNTGAAWQNPGGGWGFCPTWGVMHDCWGVGPDLMFALSGTQS